MNKRLSSLLIVVAILLAANGNAASQEPPSGETVMQKVADKLASVTKLGYKFKFEYSHASQNRNIEQSADAFLDLMPSDGTYQFRFQFTGPDSFDGYNGAERFFLDKKGKKLYVESKPSFESFGSIFMQNSPIALKYALPRLIADKSIVKKVSTIRTGDRDQYLIEFSLRKAIINSAGNIIEIRPDHTNIYRLLVDRSTLLPVEVTQTNDENDEVLKSSFTETTERPTSPTPESWYFSTYESEYALQKKDTLTLIEPGKTAPKFDLASFGTGEKVSLESHKEKLVLLEFWITNCGFCIAAVPKLNSISERFGNKGLKVIAINGYDNTSSIELFKKKNGPGYTILTNGESVSTAYGIDSYPALILIGKDGKVAYASLGLHEKELEAAIIANLQP